MSESIKERVGRDDRNRGRRRRRRGEGRGEEGGRMQWREGERENDGWIEGGEMERWA